MHLYELYLHNGKQGNEHKHSRELFVSQNDRTARKYGENALMDTKKYYEFEVTKIDEVNGYSITVEPMKYKD